MRRGVTQGAKEDEKKKVSAGSLHNSGKRLNVNQLKFKAILKDLMIFHPSSNKPDIKHVAYFGFFVQKKTASRDAASSTRGFVPDCPVM
jgi:hypothetical protein